MNNSFQVTLLAALAVLAIGAGVAVAGSGYGPGHGHEGASADGKGKGKGERWREFKDLEDTDQAFVAYLTPRAEVDEEGSNGAGDPGARGAAMFFVKDRQTLCYSFLIRGAETPSLAHIHRAPAGQNGDPVIDFSASGLPKNGTAPAGDPGWSSGCKVLDAAKGEVQAFRRILKNPGGYYVNIHTEPSFPGGAVRGQLGRMLFDND